MKGYREPRRSRRHLLVVAGAEARSRYRRWMSSIPPPSASCRIHESFVLASASLTAPATAAEALSSRVGRSRRVVLLDENPWTPAIVPFVDLARLACPFATIELLSASEWMVQTCHTIQLSDEEMAWLGALLTESPIAEIASQSAMSERSMYRRLKGLYKKLDANNRYEAIAAAVEAGYSRGSLTDVASRPPVNRRKGRNR